MTNFLPAAPFSAIIAANMKISVRFTAAVHTLLCILYFEKDYRVTSDFIAESTGVNAVIIRKILLQLQKAGLVKTAAGVGGVPKTANSHTPFNSSLFISPCCSPPPDGSFA
ncbi:transcriptional regulator [Treponema vincentii ATCC 35580]|uniref:Transcriptional regulator n=1 Tax=Treponema vincentii ATCC 35580 TaxID=596324 RepID=C8PRF6_9SPIR|nr:transcriptional regulator [Treponema vincentii ATCC 35580]